MPKNIGSQEVLKTLKRTGSFAGNVSLSDLNELGRMLKDTKICFRPTNVGTSRILANTAMAALLFGGVTIAVTGNYVIAAGMAAAGAGLAYWLSSYAITVTPTGSRDADGVPIWSLEIHAL